MPRSTLKDVSAEIAQLKEMIAALADRLAQMEVAPPSQPAAAAPVEERISEETLIAISAALAAYLGKRPRIRQVRLVGSAAWAQQGRVSIQASHRLDMPRG